MFRKAIDINIKVIGLLEETRLEGSNSINKSSSVNSEAN